MNSQIRGGLVDQFWRLDTDGILEPLIGKVILPQQVHILRDRVRACIAAARKAGRPMAVQSQSRSIYRRFGGCTPPAPASGRLQTAEDYSHICSETAGSIPNAS